MITTVPLSIKMVPTTPLTSNILFFRNVSLYCEVMDGNPTLLTGVMWYKYVTTAPLTFM